MLRGRARGAPRAAETCLPGVVPRVGRVEGDSEEEATAVVVMVVEALVAEVEVMVVEATVVGVVAVKA